MQRFACMMLAVVGTATSAHAIGPESEASAALQTCIDAAGYSDLSMKDCYVALANAEDARLNRNWRTLMAAVDGSASEAGAALLAEQRAWIAYKEVACSHYLASGGTLDRLAGQVCYTENITRRADELETLADYYELSHP